MESIAKRARSAMQLALLASILLLVPWLNVPRDLPDDIVDTVDSVVRLRLGWPDFVRILDEETQDKLFHYSIGLHSESTPTSRRDRLKLAARLPVAELLKLEGNLTDVDLYNFSESIQDHPDADLLIKAFRDLQSSLPRLREIYYGSGLGSSATFAQLIEMSRGRVNLPFVGEIAYVERAVPVITGATILILLYLVSLAKALRWSLERHLDENAMDWIFFHPGWLSVVLGVSWLLLPPAVIAASAWIGVVDWITGSFLLLPLVASSAWAIYECLQVRSDLNRKLSPPPNKGS